MCFFLVSAAIWTSTVGKESMEYSQEKENEQDEFQIAFYRYDMGLDTFVGYIPHNM